MNTGGRKFTDKNVTNLLTKTSQIYWQKRHKFTDKNVENLLKKYRKKTDKNVNIFWTLASTLPTSASHICDNYLSTIHIFLWVFCQSIVTPGWPGVSLYSLLWDEHKSKVWVCVFLIFIYAYIHLHIYYCTMV